LKECNTSLSCATMQKNWTPYRRTSQPCSYIVYIRIVAPGRIEQHALAQSVNCSRESATSVISQ
jgi:hypothetical protein